MKKNIGKKRSGRFSTDDRTRELVWIRAAGHCELCGSDLTVDLRTGGKFRWGEVAHILPASPKGPRGAEAYTERQAKQLSNDPANLMLACPGCHSKADTDDEGYPAEDLSALHEAYLNRIRLAAKVPGDEKALALIFLSQHFDTLNSINSSDLLRVMSAEGLTALETPLKLVLPGPPSTGRDQGYWQTVKDYVQYKLTCAIARAGAFHGDIPVLAVVGLADIPALMMLGQSLGDRSQRRMFSFHRTTGMRWPDLKARAPNFQYKPLTDARGPIALVMSISAEIPERDVIHALPGARIATINIDEPSTLMVKNRGVIEAFRDAIQKPLSDLEASTAEPIHVFAAIPAALAIEFGAFLTMQHRHPYIIYDREGGPFVPMLKLGYHKGDVR